MTVEDLKGGTEALKILQDKLIIAPVKPTETKKGDFGWREESKSWMDEEVLCRNEEELVRSVCPNEFVIIVFAFDQNGPM